MRIKDLKPGMILEDVIYKDKEGYKKRVVSAAGFLEEPEKSGQKSVIKPAPEGLNEDDIKRIKELHRTGKLKESEVRIAQTLPFAPFLLAGVLMTILAHGNAFMALKAFILKG